MCQSLFQAQRMGLRLRGSSPVGDSAVRPLLPQPPSTHPSAPPFPGASEAGPEDKSQTEAWNRWQSSARRVCLSQAARGWGHCRPRVKGITGGDPLVHCSVICAWLPGPQSARYTCTCPSPRSHTSTCRSSARPPCLHPRGLASPVLGEGSSHLPSAPLGQEWAPQGDDRA